MVDFTKITPLDWQTLIVNPDNGKPTEQFIRIWSQLFGNTEVLEANKVSGPASSGNNHLARWDGTSGKALKNSSVIVDDLGNMFGIANFAAVGGGFLAANISGYTGLWLGADAFSPDLTNYSLLKESFGPLYNAPAGGLQAFRIGNDNKLNIGPTGAVINRSTNVGPDSGFAFQVFSPDYSTEWMGINASGVRVVDDAYGSGWNGNLTVPTKNAVYDKIESLSPGGGGYNPPTTATFSIDIGSDKTVTGDTGGISIITTANTAGLQARMTAVSAPATFIVGCRGNPQATFNSIGLVVRDTAGKFITLGDLAGDTVELGQWTNATTFSSSGYSAPWKSIPLYFKITIDSSNDIQCSVSQTRDGPWLDLLGSVNTFLSTVDAVGFYCNRNNGSFNPVAWFFDYDLS